MEKGKDYDENEGLPIALAEPGRTSAVVTPPAIESS